MTSIPQRTKVVTQTGDAIVNINAHPHSTDSNTDLTAELSTLTGTGRINVIYHAAHPHRPISSDHRVQSGGDMYLTYESAGFNGLIDVDSKNYTLRNVQSEGPIHFVGDRNGGDKLNIHTNGWVGVYF
jgi:hypothetical protein